MALAIPRRNFDRPWEQIQYGGRGHSLRRFGPEYRRLGRNGKCNHWKYQNGVRVSNGFREACVFGRCCHGKLACDCLPCMTYFETHREFPGNRLRLQRRRLEELFAPDVDDGRFIPNYRPGYFYDDFDDFEDPYGGIDDDDIYDLDDDLLSEIGSESSYTRRRPLDGRHAGELIPPGNHYRGPAGLHGHGQPHVLGPPHQHYHQPGHRYLRQRLQHIDPRYGGQGHGLGHGRMHGGYPGMGMMGERRSHYKGNITPFTEESW